MADTFDAFNPPKKYTDPKGLGGNRDFPAHVHKWAGRDKDGNVLLNHFKVVVDEADKAARLREGWSATPVHTEPVEDDAPEADAPRKPGRPKKDAA